MTRLELLAPARDLECAIAAIDHGADAVYIGGPSFSARKAASNPMAHIERLARHAHRFHARVYLALNTILFEDELEAARKTAHEAWDAGVDGLIVQDMGLLELDLPPVPLIASTQMHNMDPEHVAFLERVGFSRVILARELSLKAIQRIRSAASIELEVFVHGALCVSFSGRCYLSASMGGRSANRGECGQPCRLPWTLRDDRGRPLTQGLHLLSLKDLDRSASIRELIHAGVTAFKIEGRLKDAAYVKNITAFYRRLIDSAISSESGLGKSSSGHCRTSFTPDPRKTFHRGGTPFFLREGDDDIACPITPKSTGEEVGTVRSAGASWFTLEAGPGGIEAGDGICYVDPTGVVRGAKVVGRDGEKILVFGHAEGLVPGVNIMRNHDHRFWRMLKSSTGVRHVEVSLSFGETPRGFRLRATDEDGITGEVVLDNPKVPARDPEAAMATLRRQLGKAGGSMFSVRSIEIDSAAYFIPVSSINKMRRDVLAGLEEARISSHPREARRRVHGPLPPYPVTTLDYRFNVSNSLARRFYERHGVALIEDAFELKRPRPPAVVMTSRHCIRRLLGACLRTKDGPRLPARLFIEHSGRTFALAFDCDACLMHVLTTR